MMDFNFVSPTKIVFGKNKEEEIGALCKEFNFSNILIVMGSNHVIECGLYDRVVKILEKNNINYILLKGVRANPNIEKVKEGLDLIKGKNIDGVLAIGGGSVIDTAKLIASGYYYDGDPFDFNLGKAKPSKALKVGVILTLSAAGSELSNSSVIQNDELKIKSGFNSDFNRPAFVIENPELTYTVSKSQTVNGIVDILMHTLERYLQPSNDIELSDRFAEGLLKTVIEAGRIAVKIPYDYEARATLMLASSYSHNGITGLGKYFFMPVHKFEHVVSAFYPNIAHGTGLAIIYPRWANFYRKYDVNKFAKLARIMFDVKQEDDELASKIFVQEIYNYFKEIGAPMTFAQAGVNSPDIESMAKSLTKTGDVYHYKEPATFDVCKNIYSECLKEM